MSGVTNEAKQLIVGSLGAVAGGLLGIPGGPAGIMKGAALGWQGGRILGRFLFPVSGDTPALSDVQIQTCAYGIPRTLIYGTMRVAGNIIWNTDVQVIGQPSNPGAGGVSQSYGGSPVEEGGKGGHRTSPGGHNRGNGGLFGEDTADAVLYTSVAIAFSEGPVTAISRIWANDVLIYDQANTTGPMTVPHYSSTLRFYLGTESQEIDPLLEATEGVGQVPAYRSTCYVVFEYLFLNEFGGSMPTITAEICSNATAQYPSTSINPGVPVAEDNFYLSKREPFAYFFNDDTLLKVDRISNTIIDEVDLPTLIAAMPTVLGAGSSGYVTIGSIDTVVCRGKITVDQGNDAIYVSCWQGGFTFLVRLNADLLPVSHNWADRRAVLNEVGDWEGIVIGHGTDEQEKLVVVDYDTGDVRCYLLVRPPIHKFNNYKFVLLWTAPGPQTILGGGYDPTTGWRPSNLTQDASGHVWVSYNTPAEPDDTILVRYTMGGEPNTLNLNGTNYRSTNIFYNSYNSCIVCFGGEGLIVQVNAPTNNNPVTFESASATQLTEGIQRGLALSQLRWNASSAWFLHNDGVNASLRKIDLDTFAILSEYDETQWGLTFAEFIGCAFDPVNNSIWLSSTGDDVIYHLLIDRITTDSPTLGSVVADLFRRAGLSSLEYSSAGLIAALPEDLLGYVVTSMIPARTALQPLMGAFLFDIAEIDGTLQAKKRDGVVLTGGQLDAFYPDPALNETYTDPSVGVAILAGDILRRAGSWVTDGFAIGDRVRWTGFAAADSNGFGTISAFTSSNTRMTLIDIVTAVTQASTIPVTGFETTVTVQTWRVFPIQTDQMGVFASGSTPPSRIVETHAPATELPRRVLVNCADPNRGYVTSVQLFQRNRNQATQRSGKELQIEYAIAMDHVFAQTLAKKIMTAMWTENYTFEILFGPRWCLMAPMDVITIPVGSNTYIVKLLHKQEATDYTTRYLFCLEDPGIYTKTASGHAGLPHAFSVRPPIPSMAHFMNTHIAHSIDDNPGHYVAAAPASSGTWNGSGVYRSMSDNNHAPVGMVTRASTMGIVTSLIPAGSPINSFDEVTEITVKMQYGTLTSATEANVLNGANLCLIGDEFLQFKNATLVTGTTYTLSGLLRYRFGTEVFDNNHRIGDRFVLFEAGKIKRIISTTAELNLSRPHRMVTPGLSVRQGIRHDFVNTGAGLKPYAPSLYPGYLYYSVTKKHIHLSFMPRPRFGGEWRDYVDVPCIESQQIYVADVYITGEVRTTVAAVLPNLLNLDTSWAAAGFFVGDRVRITGFENQANNIYATIASLKGTGDGSEDTQMMLTEMYTEGDYLPVTTFATDEAVGGNILVEKVARTLTGSDANSTGAQTFSPALVYLNDDQLTDLGHDAESEEVYFVVHQISPLVGRGYPLIIPFYKNPV